MSRIWEIAREVEQPVKRSLAEQQLIVLRQLNQARLACFGAYCAAAGALFMWVLDRWPGW